jgi:hypothetical protein
MTAIPTMIRFINLQAALTNCHMFSDFNTNLSNGTMIVVDAHPSD